MPAATSNMPTSTPRTSRLPLGALLVMAMTGFIVIMTETLPAGLLPQLAEGMGVSEGAAGQLVGVYALGTMLAVIPAIGLTRGMRRKPLLIAGLLGFLAANTVTALVPVFAVALLARFVAGAFAGLLWGMLATYARGISPSEHSGKALSIAMTGTPVALAIGTPIGTWLGTTVTWQFAFLAMSGLTALALLLAGVIVPDLAGNTSHHRVAMLAVLRIPGVLIIVATVFTWLFSHNLMYTYIAPFLLSEGIPLRPDVALLLFGLASLVGIWVTGLFIDRALRRIALLGTGLMVVVGIALTFTGGSALIAGAAILVWGIAFGGAATQVQTAVSAAAGDNADLGIAALTASFNLAIFAAAAVGALIIEGAGAIYLPISMAAVGAAAFGTVFFGHRFAFPRTRRP